MLILLCVLISPPNTHHIRHQPRTSCPYNSRNNITTSRDAAYFLLPAPVDKDADEDNEPRRTRRGPRTNKDNLSLLPPHDLTTSPDLNHTQLPLMGVGEPYPPLLLFRCCNCTAIFPGLPPSPSNPTRQPIR